MDKIYIQGVVQKILSKEFANSHKRKIVVYPDRLNIACIYCGDSHKNNHAKRGNLYFNKLLYICFNCDKKTSFDKLCRDYNESIDPDKKLEMIEHLDSVVTYSDYQDDVMMATADKLIDMSQLEIVFNSHETPISDFKPIQANGGIYKYLVGRGIPPHLHRDIYQGKFWRNEEESEWVIIMLNRRGNKVIGAQIRNLKEGKRRNFKIYNYETLYKWVHPEEDIDIGEMVIYNKLSYYFNILNVDFSNKITVFEGFIDSLFFPNSIGMVGVNTDSKFIESNNLDLQYFFDNDEAGHKKSEQKIKEGFPVFLWKKLFDDIVDKKNSNDPHSLLYRINKVKDLGKLSEMVPNCYKSLKLDTFFSKDVMDIKYIPKYIKRKYNKKDTIDYNKKFGEIL